MVCTYLPWKSHAGYKHLIILIPLCSLLPSAVVVLECVKRATKYRTENRIFGALGINDHFRTYHQNWTTKFVDIYQAALLKTRKRCTTSPMWIAPVVKMEVRNSSTPPPAWRLTCPLKRRGTESSSNHQFWGQVLVFMVVASWASNNHEWLHAGSAYKSLSWCYNLLKHKALKPPPRATNQGAVG